MTHRERFIRTLRCEPTKGQVPTFELVFYLTMEAFGKVHPLQRHYEQWDQMSAREGMAGGRGYIFSTSNCAYTGLPLERYKKMIELWREYGHYDI